MSRRPAPASPLPTLRRTRLPASLTQPRQKRETWQTWQTWQSGQAGQAGSPHRRAAVAVSEAALRLGEEVRALRIARGCSAAAIARDAGLSASLLSRIEHGLTSPSVDTPVRLAEALQVPPSRLFCRRNGRADLSFVPAGQGIRVHRMGEVAGFGYELLGHVLSGNLAVEPYLVHLAPEAPAFADFQQPGLQFLYLLEGRLRYRHGTRVMALEAGDALLFEARVPHGVEAVLAHPARYLVITLATRD